MIQTPDEMICGLPYQVATEPARLSVAQCFPRLRCRPSNVLLEIIVLGLVEKSTTPFESPTQPVAIYTGRSLLSVVVDIINLYLGFNCPNASSIASAKLLEHQIELEIVSCMGTTFTEVQYQGDCSIHNKATRLGRIVAIYN